MARTDWFVRKAKTNSTCNLCGQPIVKHDSITPYRSKWPHLKCAQAHEAETAQ